MVFATIEHRLRLRRGMCYQHFPVGVLEHEFWQNIQIITSVIARLTCVKTFGRMSGQLFATSQILPIPTFAWQLFHHTPGCVLHRGVHPRSRLLRLIT